MEQLFVENFFKERKDRKPTSKDVDEYFYDQKVNVEHSSNTVDLSISQSDAQKFDRKSSDLIVDMSFSLDRLEREVKERYPEFADYRFIFNKIRASLKQNSIDGVISLLDDLEELLDLALPLLNIKKNMN